MGSIQNLAKWLYEYDSLGQVKRGAKYFSDGNPVPGQQFEYGFDDIGNRKTTKAGGDENGANLRSATYTPNNLNQYSSRDVPRKIDVMGLALGTATVTATSPNALNNATAPWRKGEYFHKELSFTANTTPLWEFLTVTATSEANVTGNAYIAGTPEAFGYDLDGNLTSDGRWTYEWDAENRLRVMRSLSGSPAPERRLVFEYDSSGRRVRKTVWNDRDDGQGSEISDTAYAYDGWNMIAELDANNANAVKNSFIWGLDLSGSLQGAGGVGGLLSIKPASGNALFVAYDGNGNVMGLVDATTGTKTAEYAYGPFGEAIQLTPNANNPSPFRFSTKYQDEETGLLYYGYRYLDVSMGRWLSREPLGENESANLYCLVGNDSANHYDLNGLYGEAGHFYTTYLVARAAGYPLDAAYKLAYFSQYPDEDPKFDAINSGLDKNVQMYLHNLRGSDPSKVRAYLACLLKSSEFSEEEKGILIHGLGDSYAHAHPVKSMIPKWLGGKGDTGKESLYDPGVGHGPQGHTPDYIGNYPAKYGRYVDQLYSILKGQGQATEPPNPVLLESIKATANSFHKSAWTDKFGDPDKGQGKYEADALRNLKGGFGENPQVYVPEGGDNLAPFFGDPLSKTFRDSLIEKIKKGVHGCCLP